MNPATAILQAIGANVVRWLGGWGKRKAVQWEAELRRERMKHNGACDWCGTIWPRKEMFFVGSEMICPNCAEDYGNKIAGKEVSA